MSNASQRKIIETIDDTTESKYTKRADVGDGMLVTFRSWKYANVAMDDEAPRNRVIYAFDELAKPVVLNKTNLRKIARLLDSPRMNDWVGKQVVLFDDESVVFAGEEVGGIRVKAAPKPQAKWKPPAESGSTRDFVDDIPQ